MKQVSLSKLLTQQMLIAIAAGLLISLPITLIPSFFILQHNIDRKLEQVQALSYAEVNEHLATGWHKPNIELILQHLNADMPNATFYLTKAPLFLDQATSHIAIEPTQIKQLVTEVEQSKQPTFKTDLFNGRLYAAYPIKFKESCLACHTKAGEAGTIFPGLHAGTFAYEVPLSLAMLSSASLVIFFVLFLGSFITITFYLTNRIIQQSLLTPLQSLSNKIGAMQLDSNIQSKNWHRTPHQVLEIDQIDEKIFQHIHFIQNIYSKLDALIVTEHETGLFHRDRFNEVIQYELMRSKHYEYALSIVVIKFIGGQASNLENFMKLPTKEQASVKVQTFSQRMNQEARTTDMTFRITDDIFVVIAPETDEEGVKTMQEDILAHLKNTANIETEEDIYNFDFNFKMGYATYPDDGLTSKQLMHEAAVRMKNSDY